MEATNPKNKLNLEARTRFRNDTVWIALGWGGLMTPLAGEEAVLNVLYQPTVEGYMAISDEVFNVKESQRDQSIEQSQAEVNQERQLADAKMATEREKLAIEHVTDEYVLAVRLYDAKVRTLIMGAKEYAAEVEREQIGIEKRRAELAVAKEELHLEEVNAKIFYEAIQKAMVEADLARSQLEVAKAHVRAIMADIQAQRAELDVIEAEIKEAMAVADKATLQADVAMIMAEVITKQLADIRLDVSRKEIEAGFTYIQTKLNDLLAVWEVRTRQENLKTASEADIVAELLLILAAEKRAEDLRLIEADDNREVFQHEREETAANLESEAELKTSWRDNKLALADEKYQEDISTMDATSWARMAIAGARADVNAHKTISRRTDASEDLTITKD